MIVIINSLCQNSVVHASNMKIKSTKPTNAMNQIQVINTIGNNPISLETPTCVTKRDMCPETF